MADPTIEPTGAEEDAATGRERSIGQLTALGLTYAKRQKYALIVGISYSLFTVILQIFNLNFITNIGNNPPQNQGPGQTQPPIPRPPAIPPQIDQLTPVIIFTILALFVFVKVLYLVKLQMNIHDYERWQTHQAPLEEPEPPTEEHVPQARNQATLTRIFYVIVDNMSVAQKLSIVIYIGFLIYLQWYVRYFIGLFGFNPAPADLFNFTLYVLNFIAEAGLAVYLVFDGRQFYHWHKKLKKIQEFEQEIYEDFRD
jgi:hypothetical protein